MYELAVIGELLEKKGLMPKQEILTLTKDLIADSIPSFAVRHAEVPYVWARAQGKGGSGGSETEPEFREGIRLSA